MNKNVHREPTAEELRKHKEQHPKTLKAIVDEHKKVQNFVKGKYGRDARVMRYD